MMKYNIPLFLLCSFLGLSQAKNEKEERIPQTLFPQITHDYFNTIKAKTNTLKFYKETDGNKISYEAKFKLKKFFYSVEFDSLGKLEDIEISIKRNRIPKDVLTQIFKYFNTHYKKTILIKIQKQFVNQTEKSDKTFIEYVINNPEENYSNFEIIADIETEKKHEFREFTFNKNGQFKKSRSVNPSSYEYALY